MPEVIRRVLKIGGSLLADPDLVELTRVRLQQWDQQHETPQGLTIVLFGGGAVVDAVRQWDAIRPLDAAWVHWQCVNWLDVTYELGRKWFPEWKPIEDRKHLDDSLKIATKESLVGQLKVSRFYRPGQFPSLPQTWQTTTDSIAAALAKSFSARELVIWKSCDVPAAVDAATLSQMGIVDEAFTNAIQGFSGKVTVERLHRRC